MPQVSSGSAGPASPRPKLQNDPPAVFHSAPGPSARPRKLARHWLNFHGIGEAARPYEPDEERCWLSREEFTAVLDLAAETRVFELTFDDGNLSDIEIALPLLEERKLHASFFISTARLHTPQFVTPDHVRLLRDRGMGIGLHGHEHVSWRTLEQPELVRQLEFGRRTLADLAKTEIREASCPLGEYDRRVLRTLASMKFERVYTSDGLNWNNRSWLTPRLTLRRGMSVQQVRERVRKSPPRRRRLFMRFWVSLKAIR
jgi:peptidoglycan/xylan/chitin deacetylase (PgdA/CDA1 family)